MEEDDKFGVLFEAQSRNYRCSIQFEKIVLDRDMRSKERGRRKDETHHLQGWN